MALRLLASAVAVTVHVLTMHNSAGSPSAASRYPSRASPWRTYSVSYWLTLQPRVRVFSVGIEGMMHDERSVVSERFRDMSE